MLCLSWTAGWTGPHCFLPQSQGGRAALDHKGLHTHPETQTVKPLSSGVLTLLISATLSSGVMTLMTPGCLQAVIRLSARRITCLSGCSRRGYWGSWRCPEETIMRATVGYCKKAEFVSIWTLLRQKKCLTTSDKTVQSRVILPKKYPKEPKKKSLVLVGPAT